MKDEHTMSDYENGYSDGLEAGHDTAKENLGDEIKAIFKKHHKEEVMKAVEEVLGLFNNGQKKM